MKKFLIAAIVAAWFVTPAYAAPQDLIDLNAVTAPVISCSSSTSRVALGNAGSPNIEVYNSGSVPVFMVYGDSTVTATFPTSTASTGKIIAGGAIVIYSKLPTATYVACITASSTATVYASTGKGE